MTGDVVVLAPPPAVAPDVLGGGAVDVVGVEVVGDVPVDGVPAEVVVIAVVVVPLVLGGREVVVCFAVVLGVVFTCRDGVVCRPRPRAPVEADAGGDTTICLVPAEVLR